MTMLTFNKRYLRDLIRKWKLASYNKKFGENYKFADLNIFIPNDSAFAIKYALIKNKYEVSEKKMISKHMTANLPVIEFGGSLGIISKLIASKLDNKTKHIIVEANPNILKFCKKNATIERRKDLTFIINGAIAYGSEKVNFLISDNAVCSKIVNDGSHNLKIETTNLSKILKDYLIDESFILVMDIEGWEMDVFMNDSEVLKKCSLAIIEIHPEVFSQKGLDSDDFFNLVKKTGLHPIDKDSNVYVFARN
ncbi:FkbM family methyltransferase [Pelagibacterales bacterium]|nr:FkbM family methyltransferase [Pelagibacterales bacterium]